MSNIRVRSYLDGNAPQFLCANKNGIIPFLKAMFEQESYGSITPTAYEQDYVNNQLILTFSTNPGYSTGNLIQIVGSSKTSINDNYFRVSAVDGLRIYLKYDFTKLEDLTSGFIPSSLIVRHAPLDWNVVYSSDTQISIQSKSEDSSKNIVTFKRPHTAGYEAVPGVFNTAVHVSRIVSSSGEISEDYFETHTQSIVNNTESPFSIPIGSSYRNTSTYHIANDDTTQKYPWYIISNDKFVYLILGNIYVNYDGGYYFVTNFDRNSSNSLTIRSVFLFGDPDNSIVGSPPDPTGFVFNFTYLDPISHYTTASSSPRDYRNCYDSIINNIAIRSVNDSGISFLRDYSNLPGPTSAANLNTISINGSSAYSPFSFPGPFLQGLSFFPIYLSQYTSTATNSGAYIRSKLPFALFPLQSLRNISNTWVDLDYKVIQSGGKDVLNIVTYSGSVNNVHRTVSFELD